MSCCAVASTATVSRSRAGSDSLGGPSPSFGPSHVVDDHGRRVTVDIIHRPKRKRRSSVSRGRGGLCLRRLTIDPRSRVVATWDVITSIALIYTALVTPYEVGFLPAATSPKNTFFIINNVLTVIFTLDMVLQFFLMYEAKATPTRAVHWVHDPCKIARHYLLTWFPIDIVSIGVSGFDYISLTPDGLPNTDPLAPGSSVSNLRGMRVLRALRLIKLLRIMKGNQIFKRWETNFSVNYAALEITKAFLYTFLVAHWFACIWGLQTNFSPLMDTWVGDKGYCVDHPYDPADPNLAEVFTDIRWLDGAACVKHDKIYFAALYWSVMTITSIGYGDIAATPLNTMEQNIATILMLLGSFLWAKVIAVFVAASDRDPEETEFHRNMDQLNGFMAQELFPHEFRRRLREYFMHTKHLRSTKRDHELLQNMSNALQAEVTWKVNQKWLSRVVFLRNACEAFLVELSIHLHPHVFAPHELCPLGHLYILHRGLALYMGKLFGSGRVWGEDIILTSHHLRSSHHARALTFLDVLTIDQHELSDIAQDYPETVRAIRSHAIRLATRRAFVQAAKLRKLEDTSNLKVTFKGGADGTSTTSKPTPTFDRMFESATRGDNLHEKDALQKAAHAAPVMGALLGQMAQVCESVEQLSESNAQLRDQVQRVGSTEQQHGGLILNIFEELKGLRGAVDHVSSMIADVDSHHHHHHSSSSSRHSRLSHAVERDSTAHSSSRSSHAWTAAGRPGGVRGRLFTLSKKGSSHGAAAKHVPAGGARCADIPDGLELPQEVPSAAGVTRQNSVGSACSGKL